MKSLILALSLCSIITLPLMEALAPQAKQDQLKVDGNLNVNDNPLAVILRTPTQTVVKLSDDEYANLQKLRQAVVDEEKRLAGKYGATVPPLGSSWPMAQPRDTCEALPIGPHYEFRQQFLLIEKAK